MAEPRKPRIVVTIHGIRTRGLWQKRITPYLAEYGLVPYHIDYSWFAAFKFFFPWSREKQLQSVRDQLRNLIDKVKTRRISVIAHSFGTFLAMETLCREEGNLRYDRVVLTGSIVARDFDWNKVIIEKKWVMAVRNERVTTDRVVTFARIASSRWWKWLTRLKAGDSGRVAFTTTLPTLIERQVVGGHSETHNPVKFEQWARFVAYPHLPDDVRRVVVMEMEALRHEAASILKEAPGKLRANLFAPIDGALRIVPGAADNMNYAPEFDLEIMENHGATGTAFSQGSPCIIVKRGDTWTGNHLPGRELEKINPALRWVISLPIRSEARGTVVGVMNIDGLDNVLQDSSTKECQAVVLALHLGMLKRFGPCLEDAFRGDRPRQIEV